MKVVIIGSLKNEDKILKIKDTLEREGDNVIFYPRPRNGVEFKMIVKKCFKKISECDRVIVISKKDGNLGDGTIYELEFAEFLGKKINYCWQMLE